MTSALRDQLRQALRQPTRTEAPARSDNVTQLSDLSMLGGRWFESPHGPGYVVESRYEAGYEHGNVALHRALELDTALLAPQCRDLRLADCDPADFLYVDTETTGMGGAGTLVFMAGVAYFVGSTLHLDQYFLPAPDYEGGLLGGLAERMGKASALVSYNGKSFDVPVLETRYVLSRMKPQWKALPHLDLLHPNRRLFKGMFDSHRLPRMEQELLQFERENDAPGSEAPERYFKFQRTGDPTHLLPVLRHNAWDILSLVALAAHLSHTCGVDGAPLQAARAAEYAAVPRDRGETVWRGPGVPGRQNAARRHARAVGALPGKARALGGCGRDLGVTLRRAASTASAALRGACEGRRASAQRPEPGAGCLPRGAGPGAAWAHPAWFGAGRAECFCAGTAHFAAGNAALANLSAVDEDVVTRL